MSARSARVQYNLTLQLARFAECQLCRTLQAPKTANHCESAGAAPNLGNPRYESDINEA